MPIGANHEKMYALLIPTFVKRTSKGISSGRLSPISIMIKEPVTAVEKVIWNAFLRLNLAWITPASAVEISSAKADA